MNKEPCFKFQPVNNERGYCKEASEQSGYPQPVSEEADLQVISEQVDYMQPVSEEPGYLQPVSDDAGYIQPVSAEPALVLESEEPGYLKLVSGEAGYMQPVSDDAGYIQRVSDEPGSDSLTQSAYEHTDKQQPRNDKHFNHSATANQNIAVWFQQPIRSAEASTIHASANHNNDYYEQIADYDFIADHSLAQPNEDDQPTTVQLSISPAHGLATSYLGFVVIVSAL